MNTGTAGQHVVEELPGPFEIPFPAGVDAVELHRLIRSGEVSCVQVMRAYLEHIDRVNPLVNAIVERRDSRGLLEEAAERDAELARGHDRGWMHGFPHAVKDLADVAGLPTSRGSPIFAERPAEGDALFVHRLREAGAIVLGKTTVPEFGLGSHTFNPVHGTTRNPYDTTRSAGGSSGGAAAALACRMLPVADGSDFMGSLRNPAAWNNVLSLRPSFGRVPDPGFVASPAVHGPMARSSADLAMLLSTMAGPDPSAPLSVAEDPAIFTADLDTGVEGARIAWTGDFDGYLPTEPGLLELCRSAFPAFEQAGCTVEHALPSMPPGEAWHAFLSWRHWMQGLQLDDLYTDPETRELLKPEAVWEIEGYRRMSARDVSRACLERDRWYASVRALLEHYDFLLAPSAQVFPFDAQLRHPAEIDGRTMDTYHRWMEIVAPWTLSGLPVLNLPVGVDARGLPMGVQVIGRNRDELALLRLARAYEQATDPVHRVLPGLVR